MPVAATVGNDEQIAPLASTAQTGSAEDTAELVDVRVRRRHGEHCADAGEGLVELGRGQLGGRRQLAVTLGAELIASPEQAGDAGDDQGDPGDQRDHPHEAHAALSARAASGNSDSLSAQDRSAILIVVRTR